MRGSITVTLSLVILVLMSLFVTLLNGVRFQAIQIKSDLLAQIGMDSAFAEYHKELLEQYEMFYIDMSYGGQYGSIENVIVRMNEIVEENEKGNFAGVTLENITPISYFIASDYAGESIRKQAISHQKSITGIDLIETILNELELFQTKQLYTKNIKQEREELEAQMQVKLPSEYSITIVNMLAMLQNELGTVSDSEIDLSKTTFYRGLSVGNYNFLEEIATPSVLEEMTNEVLFGEYLLEHCSYYGEELEKSYLKYQIEYIIAGGASDQENLNAVLTAIFAMREVANYIYVSTDTQRKTEVNVVAGLVSVLIAAPQLEGIIAKLLQMIWATCESVIDLKKLVKGESVPLFKTDETWQIQLENIADIFGIEPDEENNTEGLDYKEYLRVLLLLIDPDQKAYRFMDMIESDIRKTEGNESFCIDHCIDFASMEFQFASQLGYNLAWTKKYKYGT